MDYLTVKIYFSNALQTESTTEINEQNLNINENRAFADEITFNATSGMTLNASIKADGDIKDTDNDNLTDYEELFYTYTDPLVFDSLIEGVSDGEIDLDEDGLTNAQEMEYTRIYSTNLPENNTYTRLNSLNSDSDEDGLSDYYEIFKSGTNPLISDTDGNGILDGDEKFEQTYTKNTDNDVITGISIICDFSKDINETTSIRSIMGEDMMCANVVGLVGEPFDIETTSDFDNATITFSIDSTKLDGKSLDDLLLLWYDEENDNFVELNTQVNAENNTISLTTTHFSKYMLVDKQEWFDCWKDAPNYFDTELYTPYNTSICIDCSESMENNDAPFYYAEKYPNLWTSMPQYEQTTYRKLAVERYIWAMQDENKTSLIHFEDEIPILDENICPLTNNKSVLLSKLHPFDGDGTDAKYAVQLAIGELSTQMDNHNRTIILLSDGDVNIDTSDNDIDGIIASCITNNIKIYTIGLGSGANSSVLESLAEKTNGEFFTATTANELSKIYHNIRVEQYQSIDWADNDGDNIPDYFETQGMMCSNGQLIFTDPNNPDCDGDGLLDGEEIVVTYGQKYIQGAGNEGHSISAVYFTYKSNPNKPDSDGDGILDSADDLPLVQLTEEEQIIKNFIENAELFELEVLFKGGLIDIYPNILDRIKFVEILRECNDKSSDYYHQALYDAGLVSYAKGNFDFFDDFSTEYNMMSQNINIEALYQQAWDTWSDSLKFVTSMWLFGISDTYCKELAKLDYTQEYKLSLKQEQILKNYIKLSTKPYNNIFSDKADYHLVNVDGFNKTRQGFKGAHCLQTLEQYSKTTRPINFIGIEKKLYRRNI